MSFFDKPEDDPDYRRCKNVLHSTTFVKKDFSCSKSWKCPEKGAKGCLAK